MTTFGTTSSNDAVHLFNEIGTSQVVLVCEHASHFMPESFQSLGLVGDDRVSHVAWDPGAFEVAKRLSERMDAALVSGAVSRLLFDCNRPPTAKNAIPEKSEATVVPGNIALDECARTERAKTFYAPFHAALAQVIAQRSGPVLVTVHSFTPVFNGQKRTVEIGVLYDSDTRLADRMLGVATAFTSLNVQRNRPYGPEHGVTHTLKEHAIGVGFLNVMLEVRNDLIATAQQQDEMADMLAEWLFTALRELHILDDPQ